MSNVRQAKVDDAAAMGRVHVRAWQAAYRGAMPDDFLDSLDADTRRAGWARLLESPRPGVETLVVEDDDGAVVGFAHIGPSRQNAEAEGEGEVYAINLDPDAWGRGLGQRLLAAATEHLAERGYREAILWVLDSNARARRFYEARGCRLIDATDGDNEEKMPDVLYEWRPTRAAAEA